MIRSNMRGTFFYSLLDREEYRHYIILKFVRHKNTQFSKYSILIEICHESKKNMRNNNLTTKMSNKIRFQVCLAKKSTNFWVLMSIVKNFDEKSLPYNFVRNVRKVSFQNMDI